MALADILPDEELRALLFSCDERLDKVEFLKRAQLISLCQAQARALAHFRSASQILPQPPASFEPIILNLIVSGDAAVGGAASDSSLIPAVTLCEKGVGNGSAILDTRSVSSQITTTRPATGSSSTRRLTRQAPPVRVERHFYHAVDSVSGTLDTSGSQDITAVYESGESEDESEYPPGYYDESEDDCGESGSHLASPEFCPSQLAQASALGTGSQGESHGGVLDVAAANFFPPTFISTGNASLSSERVGPVGDGYDDESYDNHSDDHEGHDSGGAYENEAGHSDYGSGDHYDSGSGGASSGSYEGYSSGSS
ncbi:hypothetical protein CYMTET_6400 [Cymbomonas tetramitiformis]|uniref:Uncharacterized protein n=1 Tax=Cymbomonas tetramitiformis TaxID=36881 RepID=A0AAE0LIF4_9CHLO|nr:hypothetical protein CYMTET_6400 [Cymbomonas tetramitiformis]